MENYKTRLKGRNYRFITIAFLAGIVVISCSAPKTKPYAEVVKLPTEQLQNGRILFDNYCASCHPEGMSGVGLAIINKPLPKALIKFQIRNGIGVMPAFNEEQLSDEQVENIAEYLHYLRTNRNKD
ncbi:cytochrome c [Zunongwangia sp. F260]|uniref:Cytochrome c n=1 Tax=Autumnicola lenta TaxID=3075593 RepID=A0ABU3CJB3_9FLAO|nr:cytochrome c [Zunongwangia sp. F260]MDT0646446.1 cytochrome c [Zunongwangia sp. F260]